MNAILRNKVECEVFQFNNDMNVFNGKNIKVELDDKGIVSIVHKVKIPVLKCDYTSHWKKEVFNSVCIIG